MRRQVTPALAFAALLASAASAQLPAPERIAVSTPIADWLDAGPLDELVTLYREFHRKPEISFREVDTSKRLAAALEAAGMESVTRNVGGLGVVAVLENGEGPRILLRGDMDALPIGERTGLDYMSEMRRESPDGRVEGVMHACGHDIHMTNLVGTARFLAEHRALWSGTLVCIGQPAEERGAGARAMLEDGLFERFGRPDYALALHVSAEHATGTVAVRPGPAMANVDSVDITMRGRGGHGSTPHVTIDPVMLASHLVVDLQTIVSREISPLDPAVITVGSIHGGTKHNIIGDRCELQLTVRSFTDEVRRSLHEGIIRKAKAIAAGAGAPEPIIEFSEGTPSLSNDPALVARLRAVFTSVLGADNVLENPMVMGGEDFAHFGRNGIPSVLYRLGTVAPERIEAAEAAGTSLPGLHSALYYPDAEASLRTGVRTMAAAALHLFAD